MLRKTLLALAVTALPLAVQAREYPIGKPQFHSGMEVGAVYLQPVKMDPEGMMRPAEASDIHLEADISATGDNRNGFQEGAWVPYLLIRYALEKDGSDEKIDGGLMPMVASDGPHYGDNVKLMGPGRYRLKLTVLPPAANAHAHFGRHTDRETGVGAWFEPFELNYAFTYAGIGKKGGY